MNIIVSVTKNMNNGSDMPDIEFSMIRGSNKNNTAPSIEIFFLKNVLQIK